MTSTADTDRDGGASHLPTEDLAEQVVRRVRQKLPDPVEWVNPTGYRQSLALCVIDSIQSLGVHYGSVEAVVRRYRAARPTQADTDGAPELLRTFDDRGETAA